MAANSSEGISSDVTYAGFWARAVAVFFDQAVILSVGLIVGLFEFIVLGAQTAFGGIVFFLVNLLYWPVMESSARQATFGKQLVGIEVTDIDGRRLTFLRAFLRNLAKIVSAITLSIGYLLAAFTERKQALHDMMTKCLVIQTRPSNLLGVFIKAVAVLVIVGGGCAAYFYFVVMPKMADQLTLTVRPAVEGAPAGQAIPQPKKRHIVKKAAAPEPVEPAAPEPAPAVLSPPEKSEAKSETASQEVVARAVEAAKPPPVAPSPVIEPPAVTQATISAPVSSAVGSSDTQAVTKTAFPRPKKHKTGDLRDCLSLPTNEAISRCAGE